MLLLTKHSPAKTSLAGLSNIKNAQQAKVA